MQAGAEGSAAAAKRQREADEVAAFVPVRAGSASNASKGSSMTGSEEEEDVESGDSLSDSEIFVNEGDDTVCVVQGATSHNAAELQASRSRELDLVGELMKPPGGSNQNEGTRKHLLDTHQRRLLLQHLVLILQQSRALRLPIATQTHLDMFARTRGGRSVACFDTPRFYILCWMNVLCLI